MSGDLAAPVSGQKKALLTQGSFNESTVILMEKQQKINYGQPGSMEYILRSQIAKSVDGLVKMSPGTANRILEDLNFPGQREVSERRVYGHCHAIIKGDWLDAYVVTFVALPDGRIWLVDGQHRLTAISRQESPVGITLRIVDVESEKEARTFYAGFDTKDSVRTNKQILDAVGIAQELGLTNRMTRAVFEAAPLILNNMEPITGSNNVSKHPEIFLQHCRMTVVTEWAKQAIEYDQATKKAGKGLYESLRKTGPVAVGLYTFRHQPARAKEFWEGVANNDGLRRGDPRHTLITDFGIRDIGSGSTRQRVQQSALAWNAFCEKRDLKIIKCIVGAPITLWGTPLSNKGSK